MSAQQNTNTNENGNLVHSSTPIVADQKVKEPLKFVFQLIYIIVIFVPVVVWSALKMFFTKEKSVKGQVALVTGGAQGLGRELCFHLARLGCSIACVDINDKGSEETVNTIKEKYPGTKAFAYHCDVRSKDEIRQLRENVKKDLDQVDLLIHNAGDVTSHYLTNFEDKYLDNMIDLNLKSHFLMYREFLPEMLKRNSGHIVAIASLASVYTTVNFSIYTATKHGVLALMETLQLELNQTPNNNVKTTCVCPYFIYTNSRYIREWDIRMPALTVETAAQGIVSGIRKERRVISIPPMFYSLAVLLRLLPHYISDFSREILYVRLTPSTKSTKLRVD